MKLLDTSRILKAAKNLDPGPFKLWLAMFARSDDKHRVECTVTDIASEYYIKTRTVWRWMDALKEAGAVTPLARTHHGPSVYKMRYPLDRSSDQRKRGYARKARPGKTSSKR